jgi:hypothetical protein
MKGTAVQIVAGQPYASQHAPLDCSCNVAKIRAVHTYLNEYFPEHSLNDFHATSRLMQQGRAPRYESHHVIRISDDDGHSYNAILLNEFLECAMDDVGAFLQRWNLAATLRGERIAIIAEDGVSSL